MKKVLIFIFLLVPLCGWGQNVVVNPGFDMTPWDTGWTIEIDTSTTPPTDGYATAIAEVKADTGKSPPNCCHLKTYVDLYTPASSDAGEAYAEAMVWQTFNEITGCTVKAQVKCYWFIYAGYFLICPWELKIVIEVYANNVWQSVWDTISPNPWDGSGGDSTIWSEVSIYVNNSITGIRFHAISSLDCDLLVSSRTIWVDFLVDDVYIGETGVEEHQLPVISHKSQVEVYPNPFVQRTVLGYQIPIKSKVSLMIYDISGRCVKILVDEEKKPGYYNIILDIKGLTSGVYFAKFKAGNYKEVKKLILMKK